MNLINVDAFTALKDRSDPFVFEYFYFRFSENRSSVVRFESRVVLKMISNWSWPSYHQTSQDTQTRKQNHFSNTYYIDHKVLTKHHYDLLFDLYSPQIGF